MAGNGGRHSKEVSWHFFGKTGAGRVGIIVRIYFRKPRIWHVLSLSKLCHFEGCDPFVSK